LIDQATIERLVREVLARMDTQPPAPEDAPGIGMEAIPDITSEQVRAKPLLEHAEDPESLQRMLEKTPARIGSGHTGARLKTQTLLTLRADHAAARDAVMADVDSALLEKCGLFTVQTLCSSRDEHLTRPDLGRTFAPETLAELKQRCKANPRVQVYVSDGLSSKAIEANVADFLPILTDALAQKGIELGTPFFVRYGRVPAMDLLAQTLGSEVTCVLIGERPGLASAKSMSAYIAYRATVGMPEARRTVISNIHEGGISAVEAGAYTADVIEKMLALKQSGVELRM